MLFAADGQKFVHLPQCLYTATDPFAPSRTGDSRALKLSHRYRQVRSNALSRLLAPAFGGGETRS